MSTTDKKSKNLYPRVYASNEVKSAIIDNKNVGNVDILCPEEVLIHDISSTSVLMKQDDDLLEELEDPENRGSWSGRFDFLMSLLSYSVGLGNVWRFPYLCYSNGGGAFLFPFIIMLVLIGYPLMFMELSFGQFAAMGPAVIFDRICPIFTGLGYGMVAVSAMVALYYTVIISWAFLYLFRSLDAELPWERCHIEWVEMLGLSDGIETMGHIQWPVALCLLLSWSLTFLALSKGVKSVGKVVYFTALFPYVVLTVLFIRGITLPGARDGILFYVTPNFRQLTLAKTWVAAAVQIFFALSPAWGGLITLSSYNKFHNNCLKDSMIVALCNVLTSIFAGCVIFPIIGYLAKELNMPIDQVVDQGPGLAFVVFPDVVTRLPFSPLWSVLFFFMLITLGMGSEFALLETVMTAVQDTFPKLRAKKTWVVLFVCVAGFLSGLPLCTQITNSITRNIKNSTDLPLADAIADTCMMQRSANIKIPLTTVHFVADNATHVFSSTATGGMYILQLMDTYSSSWAVFLMAVTECVILAWIYGADRFLQDIEMMIGETNAFVRMFFRTFWKYLTPVTLLFLMFFNWIQYTRMTYNGKLYPLWAETIGWLMAVLPVVLICSLTVHKWIRPGYSDTVATDRSFVHKLNHLLKATPRWGPAVRVVSRQEYNPLPVDPFIPTTDHMQCGQDPYETKI